MASDSRSALHQEQLASEVHGAMPSAAIRVIVAIAIGLVLMSSSIDAECHIGLSVSAGTNGWSLFLLSEDVHGPALARGSTWSRQNPIAMAMRRPASFCHGVRKTCRLVRPLRLLADFFSLLPLSDKYPMRGLPTSLCPYIVPLLAA